MVEVPIWEKENITVEEAAALTHIGTKKIRDLAKEHDCDFALYVGSKILIKRKRFFEFLDNRTVL